MKNIKTLKNGHITLPLITAACVFALASACSHQKPEGTQSADQPIAPADASVVAGTDPAPSPSPSGSPVAAAASTNDPASVTAPTDAPKDAATTTQASTDTTQQATAEDTTAPPKKTKAKHGARKAKSSVNPPEQVQEPQQTAANPAQPEPSAPQAPAPQQPAPVAAAAAAAITQPNVQAPPPAQPVAEATARVPASPHDTAATRAEHNPSGDTEAEGASSGILGSLDGQSYSPDCNLRPCCAGGVFAFWKRKNAAMS